MTESQLKVKVIKMMREEFPGMWIYSTSDRWKSGIPDILGCYWGRMVGIELKTTRGKEGSHFKLQLHVLSLIREAGGIAGVCYSVQEVKNLLRGGEAESRQAHNLKNAGATPAPATTEGR
jgi:hypothetical protein